MSGSNRNIYDDENSIWLGHVKIILKAFGDTTWLLIIQDCR